jgi:hypothetical protein
MIIKHYLIKNIREGLTFKIKIAIKNVNFISKYSLIFFK